MDALQFAYWLQGFAELNDQPPSPEQWQSIRDHLQTVFVKVTPHIARPHSAVIGTYSNTEQSNPNTTPYLSPNSIRPVAQC